MKKTKFKTVAISIVVILVVLFFGSAAINGLINAAGDKQSSQGPQAPTSQVPEYTTVAKLNNIQYDASKNNYYIATNIDLTDSSLKDKVKAVITDLKSKNGNSEFQARVYTDKQMASDEAKATQVDPQKKELALIALYDGGYDTETFTPSSSDTAYTINWFPAATTNNVSIGKYVGHDYWKP